MSKVGRWLVILCCALTVSQNSMAVGSITEISNQPPAIQRKSQNIAGSRGTGIQMQDSVRTAQGKAGITFEDNTKVQITENSRLVIDEFVYDPKSNKGGKLAVKVALGTVRYASGQIAKQAPQNVAVTTPTATIGVRGTDFTATVDELGRSIIILLPSCPARYRDIADCKTGEIIVTSEAGTVIMNQPFQATRVDTASNKPSKPVILNLNDFQINNMILLAPPQELKQDQQTRTVMKNALDVDFLKETGLVNQLDIAQVETWRDRLSSTFLDAELLANVLDVLNAQLAAQLEMLNNATRGLLPDYNSLSGVIAAVDEYTVELSRDDGSNKISVAVPKNQNSTVRMVQGSMEISNRVNQGENTLIIIRQSQ